LTGQEQEVCVCVSALVCACVRSGHFSNDRTIQYADRGKPYAVVYKYRYIILLLLLGAGSILDCVIGFFH